MNNGPVLYRFIALTGFLFFMFSISFMPLRIESLLNKNAELIRLREEQEAEAELQTMDHDLLKDQMEELNLEVSNTSNQISERISHTAQLNDSINRLMERAVNEPYLLDTIEQIYNDGIMSDEIQIDSLNTIFRDKSNALIEQIRLYNRKDRDLKILHAVMKEKSVRSGYLSVLIPAHLGIFILTFVSGLYLFIRGIRKWQKVSADNRHREMEL
ncbi:MAG: hypothetical protein JSV24_11265 [Bacteroidales bacterium]|nr:MAG: hypothetical protein JSV24_11265 [Bacteroidales bacterium]